MHQTPQPDDGDQVMVVGPDGRPLGTVPAHLLAAAGGTGTGAQAGAEPDDEGTDDAAEQVSSPAKVMRIGTMTKQLLEEVRHAPLDEASRKRLKEIHASSVAELAEGLSPDLREELERLTLPFVDDEIPSESEIRIAQAQLVGWLEGLFHGIQTALFAQQMAARVQLEQMRGRALPPGTGDGAFGGVPEPDEDSSAPGGSRRPGSSSGPYL